MIKVTLSSLILGVITIGAFAQGIQIKAGDQFPSLSIKNLINSPVKSVQLGEEQGNKIYILNLWGTWCAPCIPEMDSLAKLQSSNAETIQVIGISDDAPSRLKAYLEKKPSKIWLSSDTSGFFYQLFAFAYVGQSAIVNAKGKVVALVKTDSISQTMINHLLKGLPVKSTAEFKLKALDNNKDIFGVDSSLNHSFTLRGYIKSEHSGIKRYKNDLFKGRRLSFTNASIVAMYKDAYNIVSEKQLVFEVPEKEISDYDNKATLYSVDLLVKPGQEDSLLLILQDKLRAMFPVKVRVEYKEMPVYALVNNGFNQKESKVKELSYGFSGRGYDGQGATLSNFANDYLSNEFNLPVVDETGLTKQYDIKTNVTLRDRESILKSINNIGLNLIKKDKKMKVLIFYK